MLMWKEEWQLYLDVFMWKCDCYFSNCNNLFVTLFGRMSEVHEMQKGWTLSYMKWVFPPTLSAFEWSTCELLFPIDSECAILHIICEMTFFYLTFVFTNEAILSWCA
jgi:hypothetical protein